MIFAFIEGLEYYANAGYAENLTHFKLVFIVTVIHIAERMGFDVPAGRTRTSDYLPRERHQVRTVGIAWSYLTC